MNKLKWVINSKLHWREVFLCCLSDLQGIAVLQPRFLLFFSFRKDKVVFFHFTLLPKKTKIFLFFKSWKPKVSLEELSLHSAGRYSYSIDKYMCAVLNLANLGTKSVISLEFRHVCLRCWALPPQKKVSVFFAAAS